MSASRSAGRRRRRTALDQDHRDPTAVERREGQDVEDGEVDREQADEEELAHQRRLEDAPGLLRDADRAARVGRVRTEPEQPTDGVGQAARGSGSRGSTLSSNAAPDRIDRAGDGGRMLDHLGRLVAESDRPDPAAAVGIGDDARRDLDVDRAPVALDLQHDGPATVAGDVVGQVGRQLEGAGRRRR